jgi:hypothetical protein
MHDLRFSDLVAMTSPIGHIPSDLCLVLQINVG